MIIGITGGIGSGKSYVSQILRERFGIPVYDCDSEAKRLTATDEEIRRKLRALVGPDVFQGDRLDSRRLADFLFANADNASQVNAIIHPAVLRDFEQWRDEHAGDKVIALESAILYESGLDEQASLVLFIDAPEEVRLHRAMLRDSASEEQIRARMRMQRPDLNRSRAQLVIDNSTSDDTRLQELLAKVVDLEQVTVQL